MNAFEEKLINIINYIDTNEVESLQNYIENNNIPFEKFKSQNFDILIYAIEKKSSIPIIKLILKYFPYSNLNYTFYDNGTFKNKFNLTYYPHLNYNGYKVPLFSAIAINNFKVASFLIKNKANISYLSEDGNYKRKNVIQYLEQIYFLNKKNLKYILNQNFHIKNITSELLTNLINVEHNDDNLLEVIFKHYIFNTSFILGFLYFYKNKYPLSKRKLKYVIRKEKGKIKIRKNMYQQAFIQCYERMDFIELFIDYDIRDQTAILHHINVYVLLENALFIEAYGMVRRILSNPHLKFDVLKLENILIDEINNARYDNVKISLDTLKNNKSFKFSNINFENLLLKAIKENPLYLKSKEIKEINVKIIILILQYIFNISSLDDTNTNCIKNISFIKNFDADYLSLILNALIKIHQLSLIKFLLENEELASHININVKDKNGRYPIFTALYNTNSKEDHFKSLEIFKYLLQKGADCTVKDDKGVMFWPSVINNKNYLTIKCLLEYSRLVDRKKILMPFPSDSSEINNATNHIKINKVIIIKKSLTKAIAENDINTVQCFIKEYRINISSDFLIYSYLLNHRDIFDLLMGKGDINGKDKYNNTLLFYAVVKGDIDTVKSLIEKNVNINFKAYQRQETKLENNFNKNYLLWHNALDYGFKKYLILLNNFHGSSGRKSKESKYNHLGNSSLHISIYTRNKELFFILLNHKNILVDSLNEQEETPLIVLIQSPFFSVEDKIEMIKCLLEKGADINYIDRYNKKSTLAYAIEYQSLPIVKYLVDNGAKFSDETDEVKRQYSMIKFIVSKGDIKIFKYFIAFMNENLFHDQYLICSLIRIFNSAVNLEIFEFLVANIIKQNDLTEDLIPYLISVHRFDLLKLFVKHTLNLKGTSKDFGEKALRFALTHRILSVAEYLIKSGVDPTNIKEEMEIGRAHV